ncbi:MAG: 3-hydroxyacyl-CoA dehydrogenase family protein [Alphaproteobacteria bacterium]|nr:3-hydroxyacyl-CoA dehydrogenase family protein [Alphaproteobacteria bacterium]MDP6815446.1 3-hydroxyacyl-CoA dehydrogenase family protein [Alphaproteobacteria bacterium]
MTNDTITVLVGGSGVMGRGIAASFARAGVSAAILSRNPDAVDGIDPDVAVLDRLPEQPPELIIESIPELLDLKLAFNARVEAAYDGACILASNTSSLPLQDLADQLRHPRSYCGIHYFQPADVMPVVEVARVGQSDDRTIERAVELLGRAGKYPIVLAEPIQGLLINRLQHAILNEAYHLIERGICTAADIDVAGKLLLGPRMSVTGLIEQKDLSGLDTHALAQQELVPDLHHEGKASQVIVGKYTSNRLGTKTGTGFYDWRRMDVDGYRANTSGLMTEVLELLDSSRPTVPPLAEDEDA